MIQNIKHANTLCIHFQRLTGAGRIVDGPRGAYAENWGPTEDPIIVGKRIDALRGLAFVQHGEDGKALLAFGDALRQQLGGAHGHP